MLTDYEKYQLEWMIDHGYSLNDLLNKLAEIMNNELTVQGNPYVLLTEAFDIFQFEQGFYESEIWACEDEWKNNEGLEDDVVKVGDKVCVDGNIFTVTKILSQEDWGGGDIYLEFEDERGNHLHWKSWSDGGYIKKKGE